MEKRKLLPGSPLTEQLVVGAGPLEDRHVPSPCEISQKAGRERLKANGFSYKRHVFVGWHLRARIGKRWFWYLDNGMLYPKDEYADSLGVPIKLFADGEEIPPMPKERVAVVVADAVWKDDGKADDRGFLARTMDRLRKRF